MKAPRTTELGAFPRTTALALAVVIPCAATLHMAGPIDNAGAAIAAGVVGILGMYSVITLYAWIGTFVIERLFAGIAKLSSAGTTAVDDGWPEALGDIRRSDLESMKVGEIRGEPQS